MIHHHFWSSFFHFSFLVSSSLKKSSIHQAGIIKEMKEQLFKGRLSRHFMTSCDTLTESGTFTKLSKQILQGRSRYLHLTLPSRYVSMNELLITTKTLRINWILMMTLASPISSSLEELTVTPNDSDVIWRSDGQF